MTIHTKHNDIDAHGGGEGRNERAAKEREREREDGGMEERERNERKGRGTKELKGGWRGVVGERRPLAPSKNVIRT